MNAGEHQAEGTSTKGGRRVGVSRTFAGTFLATMVCLHPISLAVQDLQLDPGNSFDRDYGGPYALVCIGVSVFTLFDVPATRAYGWAGLILGITAAIAALLPSIGD